MEKRPCAQISFRFLLRMTQPQQQQLESLIARLESVAQRLEQHLASAQPSVAAAPASAPSTANMSASDAASSDPAVKAYDTLLAGPLANYLTLSAKIGDLVAKQVRLIYYQD